MSLNSQVLKAPAIALQEAVQQGILPFPSGSSHALGFDEEKRIS